MALILKRASTSRPSSKWSDDDYDVLADGVVVGRIFYAARLRASRGSHADPRLRGNARGRDGSVRQELAAGMTDRVKTRG